MSHFYASIPRSSRKTEATACGTKDTGIITHAASWDGAIKVSMWHDKQAGKDRFSVEMEEHGGNGDNATIATGTVGNQESILINGRLPFVWTD